MVRLALSLTIMAFVLVACDTAPESVIAYADVPASGDAIAGENIYNNVANPACSNCHLEGAAAAPDLVGYAAEAGQRVDGQDAREYTFYAIVEPWQHVLEGYGNAMPASYDDALSPQQIADLMAYLLQER